MKKIYVCTPLKQGKFDLPFIVKQLLKYDVFAYIPPNDPTKPKVEGGKLNRQMIDNCDQVWVFGPVGRDCSWEIGYADGLKKEIKIFLDENNKNITEDWMLWTSENIQIIDLNNLGGSL